MRRPGSRRQAPATCSPASSGHSSQPVCHRTTLRPSGPWCTVWPPTACPAAARCGHSRWHTAYARRCVSCWPADGPHPADPGRRAAPPAGRRRPLPAPTSAPPRRTARLAPMSQIDAADAGRTAMPSVDRAGAHQTHGLTVWAEIDLRALEANVRTLRALAPSSELMAVVKADAYGHGLLPVARAALRGGASWLGVAQFAEAFALRDAGLTARMLTWLSVPGSDFGGAISRDIDLSASAPW